MIINFMKRFIICLALVTIGASSMAIALYEQPQADSIKVPYQVMRAMK